MKLSGPKHPMNVNFMKISTKIMQSLYIPLKIVHNLVPYLFVLSVGWFAIQWRVQPYTAHVIPMQKNWRTEPGLQKHEENESPFFITSYQVSLCCYSDYLTFPL